MNKLFTKIVGAALGLTMAIGVGVAVASNREAVPVHAATQELTFGLTTNPGGWPTTNSTTETAYNYTLDDVTYEFTLKNVKQNSGYLMLTSTAALGLPKLSNGKLTKVVAHNSGGCSTSTRVGISSSVSSASYITGGAYQTYSTTNEDYTYNLSGTSNNTRYYIYVTNKNCQLTSISLTYEVADTYTISYNRNGGSGSMSSTTGSDPAVASCTFTAPTGKHFDHWYTTSSGTGGTSYNPGDKPGKSVDLYAIWVTNSYTVGGTITNGSLSSTANVNHGSALNISINPSSGHKLPTTLTSVTMGGSAYAGYTYNSGTGAFSIASVTGNVVINATCPVDATTYTISGSITNGSLTGDIGEQVEGDDYVVQISPSALYKYPTSVTVTGAGEEDSGWEYDSSDGIVYIYGLGGNVIISATCPAASITNITVSGQKTSFTLGEDFSFGGTIKATYDDVAGTTGQTISTDLVNIDDSAYDAFTESNSYTISVALKSNGSVSTSYTVSVARKTLPTITTWTRVTSVSELTAGGTFILGYEETANSGTIIPLRSDECAATTSAVGILYSGADASYTSGSKTSMTVANNNEYEDFLLYISSPSSGKIDIQLSSDEGNYIGAPGTTGNTAKLYAESGSNTQFTPTLGSNDHFTLVVGSATTNRDDFRYNTSAPRYAFYDGSPSELVFYKKGSSQQGTKSLIRITATGPADNTKKEDDILTADDFTVTALYDTAESGTVTQNVSVTSGATLVAGSNTVTLSYTEGGVTKTCQVTVVAAENTANLDGIVWSQEGVSRTIFEGSTIGSFGTLEKHYDDESTVALSLDDCTVAVYSNTSGSKAHDIANPASYTWNLANDNGKYLGVTYDEYTVYSGVVNVVETINAVYGKVERLTFTTKASDTNPIAVGDTVVFAYDEAKMEMVSITSGTKGVVDSFETNPAGTYQLTVEEGYASGTYAFKNGSDYVAFTSSAASASNNLWTQTTIDEKSSWTIEYDGTDVTIANCYNTGRSLRYNTSTSQERISGYVSSSTSFPLIQVYKGATAWVPSGDSIANTNAVVQKAVLEYAEHFNDIMNCVNGGTTANVSGKWSTLSGDFDDLLDSFSGDNLAHCKALFAGADAVEEGDTLQDMLARYEYICAKYKLDDFLADIDRPPVSQRTTISPLSIVGSSGNTVAIIVVISMISITAIGGYFFLRKRKED